ncbi:hypothetical protein ACEPAI_8133 [Sanghuangporus weigelae]
MAPKIPSVISCSSPALLEYELSEVRAGLEIMETEDSWDKILNALLRLNAIVIGSAADYPSQLIAACKGFVRPLINSLTSERSRLSGAATDVLTSLVTHLQRTFEALIPHFVPTLLTLAARSNKIFIARAKACLLAIVENCQSPAILPLLRHAISDKSVALRLTVVDLVVACLNCFNPPDLEAPYRAEDIEVVIRATARDPNADIRKSSRKAFEAYKILFPSRVDAFVAPFTPTMRKYLDVKNAAANQRKPLLSSSTSAPSVPSLSQSSDTLSRSQPVQGHAKSASTSAAVSTATSFTRVEKPSRSASSKPPSAANAPASDSVLMPPPPPPEKKASSGPVRPPPSMRQAIAAAAAAPTRPRLGRLASRPKLQTSGSMASDITKSLPTSSHGGAQRPEKAPTPPSTSSTSDATQSVPPPATEEPPRVRSTTGPRRVPKSEAVPGTTSAPSGPPAPSHKQAESLKETTEEKGKDKEKPTFASSTSSSRSMHADVHARSRSPSRLASSTASGTGEDEELVRQRVRVKERREAKEKEREARKRTENQAEEAFRPRPASRAEESHTRADSKNRELHPRPASRMDERQPVFRPPSRAEAKPVFSRPESRAGRPAQARPESRSEPQAPERPRKKRPVEQPSIAVQPQQVVDSEAEVLARVLAKEERRRRRAERAAEAAKAEEALTRAPSKRGKERSDQEVPSKKRRGEREEAEERRRKHREALPSRDLVNPGESTAPGQIVQQGPKERQASASEDVPLCSESSTSSTGIKNDATGATTNDSEGSEGSSQGLINIEGGSSMKEEVPPTEKTAGPDMSAKAKEADSSRPREYGGVRPLTIHKASAGNSPVDSNDDVVDINASFVPLPPSPPEPVVPETPAPLRQALAARRNQVPATPISKLLVSIQRGFEMDQNAIEEEDESEPLSQDVQPLQASSSAPEPAVFEEARVAKGEDHRRHRSHEVKAKEEDANPFFVDTRPRKHKSESSKGRGHNEARAPFMPRAENR